MNENTMYPAQLDLVMEPLEFRIELGFWGWIERNIIRPVVETFTRKAAEEGVKWFLNWLFSIF
jgi:hypothetical protein